MVNHETLVQTILHRLIKMYWGIYNIYTHIGTYKYIHTLTINEKKAICLKECKDINMAECGGK